MSDNMLGLLLISGTILSGTALLLLIRRARRGLRDRAIAVEMTNGERVPLFEFPD